MLVNETFLRWSGLRREDVAGSRLIQHLPVGDQVLYTAHCLPRLAMDGSVDEMAVEFIGGDGQRRAALLSAVRTPARSGAPASVQVAVFGAHERRRFERDLLASRQRAEKSEAQRALAEAELQHRVLHDPLTGLRNRAGLVADLPALLASAQRTVILLLDLDSFKAVNDSIGHSAGDDLLVEVAPPAARGGTGRGGSSPDWPATSSSSRRPSRESSRPGGWHSGCWTRWRPRSVLRGTELVLSASTGVALADRDRRHPRGAAAPGRRRDVPVQGDRARRVAGPAPPATRTRPRDGCSWWESCGEGSRRTSSRCTTSHGWTCAPGGCADRRRWSAGSTQSAGCSRPRRSSRWRRAPGWSAHSAEQSWTSPSRRPPHGASSPPTGLAAGVAVNLSARQLGDPDLVDIVRGALSRHGLAPDALTLEITETALVDDPVGARLAVVALQRLGVRVAIDDFGTGYSSLTYLKRFRVDELKIDRVFVAGLEHDRGDRAIVAACIQLAHAVDSSVVAEGVETDAQRRILVDLGCDLAQGFLYSRPCPPDELAVWSAGFVAVTTT